MEVSGNLATSVATGDAARSSATLAENFDTFLTLLTTQLKHQDPLEPLDSNEFVAQMVDFTNVEQAIATNKNLERLLALQTTSQMTAALGFIGRTVEAASEQVPLVDGQAQITYALAEEAASAAIVIRDESGNVVYTAPAELGTGKHSFTWDGTGANGNSLPDGLYSVAVAAQGEEGNEIETVTAVIARVTGVDTVEDGFVLSLGPAKVPITAIISVAEEQQS